MIHVQKYRELIQLNIKKQTIWLKNGTGSERHFSKEDIEMANRHMKRCSASLIIREMQIKTTIRYPLKSVRNSMIKGQAITNSGKDVEKRESLYTVDGNVN